MHAPFAEADRPASVGPDRRSLGWPRRTLGGGRFARVTVSAPPAAGTRVCEDADQLASPLLSFDGTTAITVAAGA